MRNPMMLLNRPTWINFWTSTQKTMTKLKQCAGCGEMRPIWKNDAGHRYCKNCWFKKEPPKFESKSRVLNPKSPKRAVLDQLYARLRLEFLTEHPFCKAHLNGCTVKSTDIHHKKGRGKHYLEKQTWLSVCRNCHDWIEKHPIEAKDLGFSMSRLGEQDTD
jgi:hypothetical protein